MTVQTKSSLILLVTLLLGIMIGALGMNFYKNQRMVQFKDFREREMFMGLHERIIQPHSEAQRDSIMQVLDKYLPRFKELHEKNKDEIAVIIDSLQNDLKPILSEEQWQRLIERRERMDRWGGPDKFGPPPGDRPFPGPHEGKDWKDRRPPGPNDMPPHGGDGMRPQPPQAPQ